MSPACRIRVRTFRVVPVSTDRFQLLVAARRQARAVLAKRAASRRSAPKALTVALEVMASASTAPISESMAADLRLAGRIQNCAIARLTAM